MQLPGGGYAPKAATKPGAPPSGPAGTSSANPIAYEGIVFSRELGRGVTITAAPRDSKIALALMLTPGVGIRETEPGRLLFADQVEYAITGYDPADHTLTLRLVADHRLTSEVAANPESVADITITPFLVVHRYRTDGGDWSWSWRCWGNGVCDGHLALDLSDRAYAERKAREHLAAEHAKTEG